MRWVLLPDLNTCKYDTIYCRDEKTAARAPETQSGPNNKPRGKVYGQFLV